MIKIYDTRHGRLAHLSLDKTIGASLAKYGEWAENEIYLLSQFIKKGATVIDIGAHVGTHALAFFRMVGKDGHVIALEAQHKIFQLLSMNMLINEASSVECLNALVGATTGLESICVTATEAPLNFGAVSFASRSLAEAGSARQLPIAMLTVDSLALSKCDLIKADVEGMELDVFRGAVKTIRTFLPMIYFEQASPNNLPEILRLLGEMSYQMYWHVANPFNANNFKSNSENIFGGTCEVNILAIPRERREMAEVLGLSSELITSGIYNPKSLHDSINGWALPESAYIDLAGR